MKKIYVTNEHKGYGKQNYYRNEYRLENDRVDKVKVNRRKSFDGKESSWSTSERLIASWGVTDSSMPGWLKKLL